MFLFNFFLSFFFYMKKDFPVYEGSMGKKYCKIPCEYFQSNIKKPAIFIVNIKFGFKINCIGLIKSGQ